MKKTIIALSAVLLASPVGSKVSEDSQKAWHKTKEGTEKGWDATKEGAEKGWNKTKEGASELEKKVTE